LDHSVKEWSYLYRSGNGTIIIQQSGPIIEHKLNNTLKLTCPVSLIRTASLIQQSRPIVE